MNLSFLPHLNAALNSLAFVLLVAGRVMIKNRRIAAHRTCMISAAASSALFLASYVTHYVWRARALGGSHTSYHGHGPMKFLYYATLLSHVVLAITVPVFAIWLIRLGLTQRHDLHRRVAKIGYPVWVYVSVTGVVIYVMLYWFNPTP